MKKNRKTLALLLIFSILITLLTPYVSSADTAIPNTTSTITAANTSQADALKAASLFQGTPTGYDLGTVLQRSQGLALALRAQGLEKSYTALTTADVAVTLGKVVDVDTIAGWARNPIAFALKQDPAITKGVKSFTDGRVQFAPNEEMSGKQFITFMARAMGYDATLESSLEIAINAKMLTPSQVVFYAGVAKLTRGQAVDIMYSAVKNGVLSGSGKKLVVKLVETGVTTTAAAITFGYTVTPATPTPTPVPINATLAVTSVTVPNCKQIQVVFNREVVLESLLPSYFEIKDKGTTLKPVTPSLSSDKKTVILTLDGTGALTNASTATILIKKSIRDSLGSTMSADYSKTDLAVMDTKLAEVINVSAVGSRSILIKYDEPVWNGSSNTIASNNFTVKSGIYSYIVSSANANPADRTVLLTLGSPLTIGTITVKSNAVGMVAGSVTDFAGYFSLPKEVSFNYAPDTTPVVGTLQSVNRVTQKIIVKFNKPVYGSNVRLYQLVSGIDAYGSFPLTKTEMNASDTWEFVMKSPIPTGNVNFFLVNSTVLVEQLSDLFGQKVANQNYSYSVIADTTPPSVTALYINENTSFDVLFSEEIDPTEANKIANFEVKNNAGVKQTITSAQLQVDQQTVRVLVPLTDSESYTFKVVSMKDIAGNTLTVPYSVTKVIADSSNPRVSSAYSVPSARKIYITFSEPMNTTELGTKTNYLVDTDGGTNNYQLLSDSDSVSVPDSRHVVLTLGSAITTPSVKMAAMRDLSGKKLGSDSSFEYTGEGNNLTNIGSETVSLERVDLVAYNKVMLTFNTGIAQLGSNDFLFRSDDTGNALTVAISVLGVTSYGENASGGSEIVVQLDKNFNPDGTYTDNGTVKAIEVQVQPIGTYSTSGALISSRNHTSALTIQDKFGGTIAKDASNVEMITWNDFNGDLKIDTVVIKYEEAILENTLSTMGFSVAGFSIVGISTDSDGLVSAGTAGDHAAFARYVVLNITKAGQANDIGFKPSVVQLYPIADRLGNIIQ